MIDIYTDGACQPNPGKGGWCAIIIQDDVVFEKFGRDIEVVTNNQMEMTAAIEGLSYFTESKVISVFSDSDYLIKGMKSWTKGWVKYGWRNFKGEPIKNRDLWEKLLELDKFHTIIWVHIEGHGENEYNKRADKIAQWQASIRPIYKLDEETLEYEVV